MQSLLGAQWPNGLPLEHEALTKLLMKQHWSVLSYFLWLFFPLVSIKSSIISIYAQHTQVTLHNRKWTICHLQTTLGAGCFLHGSLAAVFLQYTFSGIPLIRLPSRQTCICEELSPSPVFDGFRQFFFRLFLFQPCSMCVFFFAFFLQMPPSEHVIVPRLFNGNLHTERHRHTPHLKTLIYTHIFFMVNPARMWYAYQSFIWLSLSLAGFMYLANIFTF